METFIVIENMVQISFRELKGRKEKIKVRKGQEKTEGRKKIEKINKTKSWFLEEIYIIDRVQSEQLRKKTDDIN